MKIKSIEDQIKEAVQAFLHYVSLGWDVETSFEIAYDGVYDIVGKEAFLDRCQAGCIERKSMVNN